MNAAQLTTARAIAEQIGATDSALGAEPSFPSGEPEVEAMHLDAEGCAERICDVPGTEPTFYAVYVRRDSDDLAEWVADFATEAQAEQFAAELAIIMRNP